MFVCAIIKRNSQGSSQYEQAWQDFNNELNDYYEQTIADKRPYFDDGAMGDYLDQLAEAVNDGADLTWEIGKKTRHGYVASFEPSEEWSKKYVAFEKIPEPEQQIIAANIDFYGG
jgi:hypothetical protein|tara:strand:- start:886 stop:1230 length:345 start_codon:yes stop_codon:yes gene_type:complete